MASRDATEGSTVEGWGPDALAGAGQVPTLRDPRYSQSLERGLAILGCFAPDRRVLGIADIAAALSMSRSTTHRYAITLVALGYLEQDAARKYRLGPRLFELGGRALECADREHRRIGGRQGPAPA